MAQGAGGSGATAASLSSASGAESFRSGWQSLLASLGAGTEGLGKEEASSNGVDTAAEAASGETAGSAATSPSVRGSALRSWLGSAQKNSPEAGAASLVVHGSPAVLAVVYPSASVSLPTAPSLVTAPEAEAKSQGTARTEESSGSTHPAHSSKNARLEPASAGTAQGAGTTVDLPLATPVAGAVIPVANATEGQPQSSLTALSHSSWNAEPPSWISEPSRASAEPANAAADRTADKVEAAAPALNASPVPAKSPLAAGRSESIDAKTSATVEPATSGEPRAATASETKTATASETMTATAGEPVLSSGGGGTQFSEPVQTHAPSQPQAQLGIRRIDSGVVPSAGDGAGRDPVSASPVVLPGKAGLESGGQLSEQPVSRLAHGSSTSEPVQQRENHMAAGGAVTRPSTVVAQWAGEDASASTLTRDTAGAREAANTMGGTVAGATASAATQTAHGTFAALDAEAAPGTPSWVHAGARRAEAGFQDPDLGWVGVRADLSADGVHAALVPGSAEAAQALGGHLAGLNAYLAEQHAPVQTLTMSSPEAGGGDSAASQGMNQGTGQNTQQGGNADPQPGPWSAPVTAAAASTEGSAQTGRLDATVQSARPMGAHISVMA